MFFNRIINKLAEWSESIKEFVLKYDRNPLFYGIIFLVGLGIAYIVYDTLNKDK